MSKLKKLLIIFTAFALILSFSVFCIQDNYLKEKKQTEETGKNNSETDISTEDKLPEDKTEDNKDVRQEDLEDDSDKTQSEPPIEEQVLDTKKIIFIISYELSIEGDTSEIDFFSTIPQDYKYRQKILDVLISLRDKHNPDLVLMPHNDMHQDHEVVANEGVWAFKRTNILGYEALWNNMTFDNQMFVKLSDEHLSKKIRAVNCYKTQAGKDYTDVEYIRSLAKVRGAQIGCANAELFSVIRGII